MTRDHRRTLMLALQGVSAAYFLIDLTYEAASVADWGLHAEPVFVAHLMFEALAVGFLLVCMRLGWRYEQALQRFGNQRDQMVRAFRADFDSLIARRFDEWGLTSAERDVALLSLRGLRIAEIAQARQTRDGTVKAQISAAFHKAGVGTRAEFLALFMDEFLDFGANSAQVDPFDAAPAGAAALPPARLSDYA